MTTLEILQAARALIADPEHWTQEDWARRADGTSCWVTNTDAVCFCAVGALLRVTDKMPIIHYKAALRALGGGTEGGMLAFNDEHSHPEIIDLFDRAIEAESA